MIDKYLDVEIPVLNHGFIKLVDFMGNDLRPAQIARKSFNNQKEQSDEAERKLNKYLVLHKHNTPIEFVELVWLVKMPIITARQWVRHRTAAVEEISLRYVQASREFYIPETLRCQKQSETSKQGSSVELVDNPHLCQELIKRSGNAAFDVYSSLLTQGLSKELARTVLPLGTYTEWYWKNDLHNTLHFLGLRIDPHAQWEIRVYAIEMFKILEYMFPSIVGPWITTLPQETQDYIQEIR